MDTRGLILNQAYGVAADKQAAYTEGFLPYIPTNTVLATATAAVDGVYCKAKHSIGGGRCRTTVYFGDISDPNLSNLAITDKRRNGLKPYPLLITEASGGGYGYLTFLQFPKGYVEVGNCICRLMGTSAISTTYGTMASTFQGSFAVGTTYQASYAAPAAAAANVLTSATIVKGVASVSGSTATPGLSNTNRGTLTGILDNSGGTASATIASQTTGATFLAAHQNAIASLAAQVNNMMKLLTGSDTTGAAGGVVSTRRTFDGTTTAIGLNLNTVIYDDATAAGILYLEGRIIVDWAYISAVPITPTAYRWEGQG